MPQAEDFSWEGETLVCPGLTNPYRCRSMGEIGPWTTAVSGHQSFPLGWATRAVPVTRTLAVSEPESESESDSVLVGCSSRFWSLAFAATQSLARRLLSPTSRVTSDLTHTTPTGLALASASATATATPSSSTFLLPPPDSLTSPSLCHHPPSSPTSTSTNLQGLFIQTRPSRSLLAHRILLSVEFLSRLPRIVF